jgi:hypothetical protein
MNEQGIGGALQKPMVCKARFPGFVRQDYSMGVNPAAADPPSNPRRAA